MAADDNDETTAAPVAARIDPVGQAPHAPGVYLMYGARHEVLYVGKALDLRKRLASYARHPPHGKTGALLARVERVETILTTTEKEALILEASLIKKYRPRYNIVLRDDKNYPSLKLTVNETWPRLLVTRRRSRDGARYFGPYASATALRATLKLVHTLFPLRRCKGPLRPLLRPCLDHQMGRCLAPCAGLIDEAGYRAMVEQVVLVLEGRNRQLARQLEEQMRQAAAALDFEQAAGLRDQLQALQQTLERQVVAAGQGQERDVFGLVREDAAAALAILFVRDGLVSGCRSFFLLDPLGSEEEILTAAISQFYGPEQHPPPEILLPLAPPEAELLSERLSDLRGGGVRLRVPERGPLTQLMTMAADNARQLLRERNQGRASWQALAEALQQALGMRQRPERIECMDISNIGGKQAVGSLVCWLGGEKHAAGFRHYRITCQDSPDDYAMMAEMLRRRLDDTGEMPDLLLIDGGRGHLRVAMEAVAAAGLGERVELASIAKERGEEGEKLFRPGLAAPILLPRHAPVLLLLMRIRDEAHRFGITHHRKLRGRATLRSSLDEIPGIGPARRQLLLKHFGSVARLRAASTEELAAAPGIGPGLAALLHQHLHPGEGGQPIPHPDGTTQRKSAADVGIGLMPK